MKVWDNLLQPKLADKLDLRDCEARTCCPQSSSCDVVPLAKPGPW